MLLSGFSGVTRADVAAQNNISGPVYGLEEDNAVLMAENAAKTNLVKGLNKLAAKSNEHTDNNNLTQPKGKMVQFPKCGMMRVIGAPPPSATRLRWAK
jgi:hypothetical protein